MSNAILLNAMLKVQGFRDPLKHVTYPKVLPRFASPFGEEHQRMTNRERERERARARARERESHAHTCTLCPFGYTRIFQIPEYLRKECAHIPSIHESKKKTTATWGFPKLGYLPDYQGILLLPLFS